MAKNLASSLSVAPSQASLATPDRVTEGPRLSTRSATFVEQPDNPSIRERIFSVANLVEVEEN